MWKTSIVLLALLGSVACSSPVVEVKHSASEVETKPEVETKTNNTVEIKLVGTLEDCLLYHLFVRLPNDEHRTISLGGDTPVSCDNLVIGRTYEISLVRSAFDNRVFYLEYIKATNGKHN